MKTNTFQLLQFLLIPIGFFFLTPSIIQAQSIATGLGGVPTNLIVHSRDVPQLDVVGQHLIRRGVSFIETDAVLEFGAGYANEQIHWELLTREEVQTVRHKKMYGKDERYYEFSFLDEEGELIHFIRIKERAVKRIQNEKSKYVSYSFNFNKLPITIFEQAKKLKLEYIHKSKKH
ncbi:MAG: hypothetical protein AAGG75_14070 [Bacteroidota bacterium]